MATKQKNYVVGSSQTVSGLGTGLVVKKKCSQCRRTSMVRGPEGKHSWEACLNGCGPEALMRLLRF